MAEKVGDLFYEIGGDMSPLQTALQASDTAVQKVGRDLPVPQMQKLNGEAGKTNTSMFALLRITHALSPATDKYSFGMIRMLSSVESLVGSSKKLVAGLSIGAAALAGWNIGRLIAQMTGLDAKMEAIYTKSAKIKGSFMEWAFGLRGQKTASESELAVGKEASRKRGLDRFSTDVQDKIKQGIKPFDDWQKKYEKMNPEEKANELADQFAKGKGLERDMYWEDLAKEEERSMGLKQIAGSLTGKGTDINMTMQKAVIDANQKAKPSVAEQKAQEARDKQLKELIEIKERVGKQGIVLQ